MTHSKFQVALVAVCTWVSRFANDKDPFRISHESGGPVAVEAVQSPDRLLQDAWGRFRDRINQATKLGWTEKDGIRKKWQYLMRYEKYSVRQYLEDVEYIPSPDCMHESTDRVTRGLDSDTVRWLETATARTGWYETALTENVLESLAFEWHNGFDVTASGGVDKPVDCT